MDRREYVCNQMYKQHDLLRKGSWTDADKLEYMELNIAPYSRYWRMGMKKALKHAIRLLREEEAKADRKTEPQPDCRDCGYAWWNSDAKRYECMIKKCRYEDEPQRGCDADCNENCAECAKEWQDWKDQMWTEAVIASKTEPQTEVSYTDSTDYQGDKNYTDHTDCSWR